MRDTKIRIGNQTAFSAAMITLPFEYAVRRGFDAFEWFPDRRPDGQGWSERDFDAGARAAIGAMARDHDIALSVHAAWDASPLTAAGRSQLAAQSVFAADVGARVLVTHAAPDVAPERFAGAIVTLARDLGRAGIGLVIENTPQTTPEDLNSLFAALAKEKADGVPVGLCLDVGHANLCEATRNHYLDYVDRLSSDVPIAHVHLHENWGDRDSHLTVFTGPSADDGTGIKELLERLARRAFRGCIILEQWPEPPSLLDVARERLLALVSGLPAGPTAAMPPAHGRQRAT